MRTCLLLPGIRSRSNWRTTTDQPVFSPLRAARKRAALFLAANALGPLVLVTQHFESDELVDITGGKRGLIELHAELLHPNSGYADHKSPTKESDSIVCARAHSTLFAQKRVGLDTSMVAQNSVKI